MLERVEPFREMGTGAKGKVGEKITKDTFSVILLALPTGSMLFCLQDSLLRDFIIIVIDML